MRMDEEASSKTGSSDYWSWMKAAEVEDRKFLASRGHSLDEYTSQRVHNSNSQYAPKSLDWDGVLLPGESPPAHDSEDDDLGIGELLFGNGEEE